MNVKVTPHGLSGTVTAPVSKSSVHRLMICAALSDAESVVEYSGAVSGDILATRRCLEGLGAKITDVEDGVKITPFNRSIPASEEPMDCGDSGSTLRFLIPVAAVLGGKRKFILRNRLPERPLSPLKEELERHGVKISLEGNILNVCGDGMSGGEFVIDGGVSSQFISGLLFALPLLEDGGSVRVTGKTESRPYIDMTLSALYNYGIKIIENNGTFRLSEEQSSAPARVRAEGDWSGAAFWVCAGALSDNGIYCRGLDPKSLQGDKRCVDIVRMMGAVVEDRSDGVFVRKGTLHGIKLDATDIPDLVPVVAALAAAAEGETVITGAARLRLKESDRIETTCKMICDIGGNAVGHDDGITVTERLGNVLSPVDCADDHRIAMAAAVLSCAAKSPVTVLGADCVRKSYPMFWNDFVSLGGTIEEL